MKKNLRLRKTFHIYISDINLCAEYVRTSNKSILKMGKKKTWTDSIQNKIYIIC